MEDKYRSLKSKLEVFHDWPHEYVFKFIVPAARRSELEAVFAGRPFAVRESSGGKYASLTCRAEMPDSAAVIAVYRRVEEIEGSYAL